MAIISYAKKIFGQYREKPNIDSLKEFEAHYLKNYILSVNFEEYFNKKINTRRRINNYLYIHNDYGFEMFVSRTHTRSQIFSSVCLDSSIAAKFYLKVFLFLKT